MVSYITWSTYYTNKAVVENLIIINHPHPNKYTNINMDTMSYENFAQQLAGVYFRSCVFLLPEQLNDEVKFYLEVSVNLGFLCYS